MKRCLIGIALITLILLLIAFVGGYYHPLDPRAYTCPKCYEGATGNLCPGHYEPNEPIESIHISMMSDDGKGFSKTYTGTESEIRKALIKDGVVDANSYEESGNYEPEPKEPLTKRRGKKMQVIWPDVFIDPNYEYPDDKQKERFIADGLMGWGLCLAGNKHPESFGIGMAKIDGIIGEIATKENLMRLADEIN